MYTITFNQVCHWLVSLSPSLCSDSIGTKFGGKPGNKPGGKKPFKPYNNTEKKSRPGKGGDAGKKQNKFVVSKAGNVQQKRKLPFKGKKGGEGEGEKTSATLQCSLPCFSVYVSSLLNTDRSVFSLSPSLATAKCHMTLTSK